MVYNSEQEAPSGNRWSAYINTVADDDSIVRVRVNTASDAIVGAYKLIVKLYAVDDGVGRMYMKKKEEPIYLLFNAWNPGTPLLRARALT